MPRKIQKFEDRLQRLEEILSALEGGDAGLDELLKLYEEGVSLIRSCNEQLQNAEKTVKLLQMQPDGTVTATDFGKADGEE